MPPIITLKNQYESAFSNMTGGGSGSSSSSSSSSSSRSTNHLPLDMIQTLLLDHCPQASHLLSLYLTMGRGITHNLLIRQLDEELVRNYLL